MKKNQFAKLFTGCMAVFLCMTALKPASAYFSAHAEASGTGRIERVPDVHLTEEYRDFKKTLRIANDAGAPEVFVRAWLFADSPYVLSTEDPSGKWSLDSDLSGGGVYVFDYADPVLGGTAAADLNVNIREERVDLSRMTKSQAKPGTAGVPEGTEFSVVVAYESVPVKYDAAGKPYADWEGGEIVHEEMQ